MKLDVGLALLACFKAFANSSLLDACFEPLPNLDLGYYMSLKSIDSLRLVGNYSLRKIVRAGSLATVNFVATRLSAFMLLKAGPAR